MCTHHTLKSGSCVPTTPWKVGPVYPPHPEVAPVYPTTPWKVGHVYPPQPEKWVLCTPPHPKKWVLCTHHTLKSGSCVPTTPWNVGPIIFRRYKLSICDTQMAKWLVCQSIESGPFFFLSVYTSFLGLTSHLCGMIFVSELHMHFLLWNYSNLS